MFLHFNEKGLILKTAVEKAYRNLRYTALQLNNDEFFIFYEREGENNFKIIKYQDNKMVVIKRVISLPQEYNSKIEDFFKEIYEKVILKQNQRFGNWRDYKATLEERKASFISKIKQTPDEIFQKEVCDPAYNVKTYVPIIENLLHDEYVFRVTYKKFKGGDKYVYWESIWLDKYINEYSYKHYHGDTLHFQTSQQVEDFIDLLKLLIEKLDEKQVTNPKQYLYK